MARRIGRSPFWQETIGFLLAKYLRFVQITSRFTTVPEDLDKAIAPRDADHLRDVAWPASDDVVRLAGCDRPDRRADFAA